METWKILKTLREKHNLTQEQLAERVMVTRQAVSRWENGETQPNTDTLKLLSKEFGVSINTLLGSPRQLICQCCGMPLNEDDCISRETDGTFNEDYCKWCYINGKFVYPSKDELLNYLVGHMPNPDHLSDRERYLQFDKLLSRLKHWKSFAEFSGCSIDERKRERCKMYFVDAKGILSADNRMNIYRGCSHGCIYCDSRSSCYGFTHPFEDIEVKQNALALLEQKLRSKRTKCMIGTGAMCDPYLPCEEQLRLTRKCLELIRQYGYGAAVLTKSDRILRDLDLLCQINERTKAVAQITLTTYEDKLCRILEPNVCTTGRRVQVLKKMQEERIPTIVWLTPILPFINDTEENLRGILEYCVAAGVKGIVNFGMGVTLREGNREYFYHALDQVFPGLSEKYRNTYGYDYVINSPNNKHLLLIFRETCRKAGIMYQTDQIFDYLKEFPEKREYWQISLFDHK